MPEEHPQRLLSHQSKQQSCAKNRVEFARFDGNEEHGIVAQHEGEQSDQEYVEVAGCDGDDDGDHWRWHAAQK